jgi:hypothetical protein
MDQNFPSQKPALSQNLCNLPAAPKTKLLEARSCSANPWVNEGLG